MAKYISLTSRVKCVHFREYEQDSVFHHIVRCHTSTSTTNTHVEAHFGLCILLQSFICVPYIIGLMLLYRLSTSKHYDDASLCTYRAVSTN